MPRAFPLGLVFISAACAVQATPTSQEDVRLVPIGAAWAQTSVNAAIFRRSSVVTRGNTQFVAFYDPDARLMLARRTLGTPDWEIYRTPYTGGVRDAHNAISLAVDGEGVLHIAWDHHGQPLRYARGRRPGSLELMNPMPMTGRLESAVTYPEFYLLPDGDLLFLYRDGSSGSGNVLLNRYHIAAREWRPVQHPLIDGEGQRNAYVNRIVIDAHGRWHISWTWRETPDVATNHDVLYAVSDDEGKTWRTSAGERYTLPITAANGEVASPVAQGSELINQTSMAADTAGRPLIATYWRPPGTDVPQIHLVWNDGNGWRTSQAGNRTLAFRLSGSGTKRIPLSRPLVLAGDGAIYIVYRDEERGGAVSVAETRSANRNDWRVFDLHTGDVGMWEPTHDPELWEHHRCLHLFHLRVGQGDGETVEDMPPQTASILEWRAETRPTADSCITESPEVTGHE